MICSFNHLPTDILFQIYSRLKLKQLLTAGSTCKSWYTFLISDKVDCIWKSLCEYSDVTKYHQDPKACLKLNTRNWFLYTYSNDYYLKAKAHFYLSRLGYSTLNQVYDCIEEMRDSATLENKFLQLNKIVAAECLLSNEDTLAATIVKKMPLSDQRRELAFKLYSIFMKQKKFVRALRYLKLANDDDINEGLCKYIYTLTNRGKTKLCIKALKTFQHLKICNACIVYLQQQKIIDFTVIFPDMKIQSEDQRALFYIYIGNITTAESILHGLPYTAAKIKCYGILQRYYTNIGDYEKADKIFEIIFDSRGGKPPLI